MPPDTNGLTQLGNLVSQSAQQEVDLPNMLRDAIASKITKDTPLIQQREAAIKELYGAYGKGQEQAAQPISYQISDVPELGVYNRPRTEQTYLPPATQSRLAGDRAAAALARVTTLNDLLSGLYGGIENVIGGVTKATEAQTKKRQAEFDAAAKLADLQLKSEEITEKKRKEEEKEMEESYIEESVMQGLRDLKTMHKQLSSTDRLVSAIPFGLAGRFNPRIGQYENLKNAVGYDLARLRDTGRLSDQDVRKAMDLITPALADPETAQKNFDQAISYLEGKLKRKHGGSTGGRIRVRQKSTGKTGTIEENEFDPSLYERI